MGLMTKGFHLPSCNRHRRSFNTPGGNTNTQLQPSPNITHGQVWEEENIPATL